MNYRSRVGAGDVMMRKLPENLRAVPMALLLLFAAAVSPGVSSALAEPVTCAAPLKPMLRAELFFGRNIGSRFGVSDRQWQVFVARELTPRFPDGLTVIDGLGHSADGNSHVRERSKIVVIVTADEPATQERIVAAMNAYIKQFKQRSVGLVTQPVCAAF